MAGIKAKALVVHCMDWRIQRAVDELVASLGIVAGEFDRISVPGGAGNSGVLEEYVETSVRLHRPPVAILTVHEDCGAGAKREDLLAAAAVAGKYGLSIRAFYVKLDGSWDEVGIA